MVSGAGMAAKAADWLKLALQPDPAMLADSSRMLPWVGELVMRGFAIVLPLLVAGVVAAIVGPLALGGWNFSVKALRFDVARINPISGIGRMFSMQSLRSEEHTSELQSLMRISYAVFCLKKK